MKKKDERNHGNRLILGIGGERAYSLIGNWLALDNKNKKLLNVIKLVFHFYFLKEEKKKKNIIFSKFIFKILFIFVFLFCFFKFNHTTRDDVIHS